jgi:hypothetical protein
MSRALILGLIAGALLRAAILTSPGSPDLHTWKSWSFTAAIDPLGLYGTGGHPPERRVLRWADVTGTTEYLPLGLYELGVAGTIYRAIDPPYRDSDWLTVLIKLPGLAFEVLLVVLLLTLGARVMDPHAAKWMAMAVWLNPAIIVNGAALGYLDAQMAMPMVLAFVAVIAGRPGVAGILAAAAVLTKPQALFAGPALVLALVQQTQMPVRRALAWSIAGGATTAAAILVPIVAHGAWPNMVQAVGRAASHDMLSGYGLNAWWVVTWLVRSMYAAPELGWIDAFTTPVRILGISRFVAVGFFDPKPFAAAFVLAMIAWFCWRNRNSRSPATWAFVGGWSVLTYFVWNVPVHENHLYLAVPLLALAAALDRHYRLAFWAVSLLCALNMYLFYGLGAGWPPLIGRKWTGIDFSVIVALVTCGVWVRLATSIQAELHD